MKTKTPLTTTKTLLLPPLSFFGSCFISRAAKTKNPVPRSFFATKPNGNACYAGYTQKKNVVVEEIKEFELRSRLGKFIYNRTYNSIGLN